MVQISMRYKNKFIFAKKKVEIRPIILCCNRSQSVQFLLNLPLLAL